MAVAGARSRGARSRRADRPEHSSRSALPTILSVCAARVHILLYLYLFTYITLIRLYCLYSYCTPL